MDNSDEPKRDSRPSDRFTQTIAGKQTRKLRARREEDRAIWFWLGNFGLVGWSVAIPTLVCLAIGYWIDKRWPGPISWTLTFLFIGVVLGCVTAWYWVTRESKRE